MFHCVTLLGTAFPVSEDGGCPSRCSCLKGGLTQGSYLSLKRDRVTWGDQRVGPEIFLHGSLRGP